MYRFGFIYIQINLDSWVYLVICEMDVFEQRAIQCIHVPRTMAIITIIITLLFCMTAWGWCCVMLCVEQSTLHRNPRTLCCVLHRMWTKMRSVPYYSCVSQRQKCHIRKHYLERRIEEIAVWAAVQSWPIILPFAFMMPESGFMVYVCEAFQKTLNWWY